jgi:hypothetical protein
MKYAVEMSSGAMMNISSLIKIGSGIQKLISGQGEIHRHTDSMVISTAYFYFFKIRTIG